MRYPISIQTFATIRNGNYVYVDKTDLVYRLAQEHVCFLSRPRRFGKSLLISTLDAYFSGRRELFRGLKMEALEDKWDVYPVFRIDFAKGRFDLAGELEKVLEEYVSSWETIYGKSDIYTTLSSRFQYVLEQAAARTGHQAVILIDEYDKPLLDVLEEGFKEFFEKEVPGNPLKAEYLIPIFIGELLEQGKMSVKVLKTNDTWYGMTYHEDVAAVKGSFKEMLENGVYKADLFSDL